jgi:ornithine carbamoyltransferase
LSFNRRQLISIADLDDDDLLRLVHRGRDFAADPTGAGPVLSGCVVGTYFRVTSTRTRTAFTSGALRLGASVISYGPDDLQLNTGESVADTAAVFARMLDGLVARTAGGTPELRAFGSQQQMGFVNAMSAEEHPTQALADLTTLLQHFGTLDGLRVLYVGEGNNTAAALALACARLPRCELQLRTPPGYGLAAGNRQSASAAAAEHGARIHEQHDMHELPDAVDVIYTTRWQTTGTTKPDPAWREAFAPFRVDDALMARYPDAVFMHDLPAHRGQEVTASVLDGRASIAFRQAENKLYSAMAVLEWSLAGDCDRGVC